LEDTDKEKLKKEIDAALFEAKEQAKAKRASSSAGGSKESRSRNPIPPFVSSEKYIPGSKDFPSRPKETPYEILGVKPNASMDDIKNSYRGLARRFHPDIVGDDPEQKSRAEGWFKLINEAYETVSDPDKRIKYDLYGYEVPKNIQSEEDQSKREGEISKTAMKFWEGVYNKKSPLESFSPGLGRYEEALGPGVFRFESLDTPQGKADFMDYMVKVDREQERMDKSTFCICDSPVFPRGYRPKGRGKDTCIVCHKPVVTGNQGMNRGLKGSPDIKGLGPGMGKVR